MEEPAVVLDHVSFSYGEQLVLNDVSLQVMQNEFVGIIGPNGGGKTTLLRLLMGFLRPSQGSIRLFGETPKEFLTQIGYVPQGMRFDREFPISVMELVLSGRLSRLPWHGQYSKEDEEAACAALEKVGMLPFRDRSFGNLSGGQAQRALIARALASNPRLLLLDEPTASVDSQAENDIYKILQELRNSMTILMVTHDLTAAVNLVDRVLCVQNGVLALKPEEVCEHFAIGLYHAPIQVGKGRQPS